MILTLPQLVRSVTLAPEQGLSERRVRDARHTHKYQCTLTTGFSSKSASLYSQHFIQNGSKCSSWRQMWILQRLRACTFVCCSRPESRAFGMCLQAHFGVVQPKWKTRKSTRDTKISVCLVSVDVWRSVPGDAAIIKWLEPRVEFAIVGAVPHSPAQEIG